MCTSLVYNGNKTIVGWNLDILDMEHKVLASKDGVYIMINDKTEGWMPLFGANDRGEFVAMPTCWPYDAKSNPTNPETPNIIMLDIALLTKQKTFAEIKQIAENGAVASVPGVTFQAQLSDSQGNVLQIVPGQGIRYLEKPKYSVMANFSPFKGDSEKHPWMGLDRYEKATKMLEEAKEEFGVKECFSILKEASQTICPTMVSMVYDVNEKTVYWCENRDWDVVESYKL